MEKTELHIGQKVERWTIIGAPILVKKGEKKWFCRCECGTERYVLERSLKSGGSKSCGCLRKEKAESATAISDMEGKTFGELTVLRKAEQQRKNGGLWWTCQCSCGNLYDVPGSLLITGKRTRCSGNAHKKNYATTDITGQKFHRLTALYPLEKRDKRKSVMWHCRCDCGNEIEVSYNNLVHCNLRSCGCQKKEHNNKLKENLIHVAGTSVDLLMSQKLPINNTTGVKGVYFVRGKWMAKIVFQKKAYYLGFYEKFSEAVEARREAERIINEGTIEHYKRWKSKADIDAEWAKENPIEIQVEKKQGSGIEITFLPIMGETNLF